MASRRHARELALQALCALDAQGHGEADAEAALEHAVSEHQGGPADMEFARRLVQGGAAQRAELDDIIRGASKNWRLERMARVDRNVLRMALWELRSDPETPPRVVINEAIEIARRYGTAESSAFVNGVLDRCVRDLGLRVK